MNTLPLIMAFDVESMGLHGEAFAVGWVVVAPDGQELDAGLAGCARPRGWDADDVAWVQANVPELPVTASLPWKMREAFWTAWRKWAERGALLVADCAWPVEARLLIECIGDTEDGFYDGPNPRKWGGPYPLHDVASVRLAAGLDPLATEPRLPGEEPKHNPLADARQSARLFRDALLMIEYAKAPRLP